MIFNLWDFSIFFFVQTAIVISKEQLMRFVIKILASVYVVKVMVVQDVTNVYQDFMGKYGPSHKKSQFIHEFIVQTDILIVSLVIARQSVVFLQFVTHLEGVLAFQILEEDNVLLVKQGNGLKIFNFCDMKWDLLCVSGSTNIQNVCHVPAIHMEVLEYLAIMMVNVNVHQTLMEKDVINAKKV